MNKKVLSLYNIRIQPKLFTGGNLKSFEKVLKTISKLLTDMEHFMDIFEMKKYCVVLSTFGSAYTNNTSFGNTTRRTYTSQKLLKLRSRQFQNFVVVTEEKTFENAFQNFQNFK